MSPKDETCAVNIPAFLSKLWKIVNDPEIDNIVCWSSDGRSFVIQDQAQFWYNILPVYYKHNNMSSFVRQLNMYGFHKIHADGKDHKEHDELKFYHPFFRRNQPSLMKNIKRKMTATHRTPVKTEIAETTNQVTNLNHMTKVLVDVKQLQTRQESVDNQLASMKKENAALWRELALLRQKHMKQQQLVNKLIHFLVHIVNPSRGNMGGMGRKRKFPLMINDIAGISKSQKTSTGGSSSSEDGLIIHEVENEDLLSNEGELEGDGEASTSMDQEHNDEEIEEAMIDSPDNLIMDSTDEFLDIPMMDEVADSPDSLCPDNILAEDPNIEIVEQPHEEQVETREEEPVPDSINLNEFVVNPDGQELVASDTLYPNLNSVAEEQAAQEVEEVEEVEDKSKKKSSGKVKSNGNGKGKGKSNLTVATRSNTLPLSISIPNAETSKAITLSSPDDFENHLEATQEELDSIKELLLDGYALDPNTVLNLNSTIFTDMPLQLFMNDDNLTLPQDTPSTSLSKNSGNAEDVDFSCDPMVSGSSLGNELMPYNNSSASTNTSTSTSISTGTGTNLNNTTLNMNENMLDFENLFENETSPENTMDPSMELMNLVNMAESDTSTLNTPVQIKTDPPSFPTPTPTPTPTPIQATQASINNFKNSHKKRSNK